DLTGTKLNGAKLDKIALTLAKALTGADLTGSQHTPTPLPDYNDRTLFDLTDTKLNGAKLDKIALTLAKALTGADLTGSQHTPTPLPDYNDRTLFPHPIF
ncbi:effector protein PipB, partial [Salmonella enterica subsp. enterica serovar Pomona]